MEPGASPKSRLVLMLLACLLGNLGAHRFYAGRYAGGAGLLVLFMLGLAGATSGSVALPISPDEQLELWLAVSVGGLALLLAGSAWVLVDIISVGRGKFRDGMGRVVAAWQ